MEMGLGILIGLEIVTAITLIAVELLTSEEDE